MMLDREVVPLWRWTIGGCVVTLILRASVTVSAVEGGKADPWG